MKSTLALFFIVFISIAFYSQNEKLHFEGKLVGVADTNVSWRVVLLNAQNNQELYGEEQTLAIDSTGKWWYSLGEGNPDLSLPFSSYLDVIIADYDSLSIVFLMNDGASLISVAESRIHYVPYAYHSYTNGESKELLIILDDTSSFDVAIEFDSIWRTGKPKALVATSSWHSLNSDTANFVISDSIQFTDSAMFSFFSNNTFHSVVSGYTDSVEMSVYSDTVQFADSVLTWKLNGNLAAQNSVIGSSNPIELEFKTNDVGRLRLDSVQLLIGNNLHEDSASFTGDLTEGFMLKSSSSDYTPISPQGDVYFNWIASKANLLIGSSPDSLLDISYQGAQNFIVGKNNYSKAIRSMIVGENNRIESSGRYSFLMGKNHLSFGYYGLLSGKNCFVMNNRSVAMGDSCSAPSGYACIAMGKNVEVHGLLEPASGFGSNITRVGKYAISLGHNVNSTFRVGTFTYGDYATDTLEVPIESPGGQRWYVKARGGVGFYSSTDLSTGVYLFPGSGSWSSTSSIFSKNILCESKDILQKLETLNIYNWNYIANDIDHIGPFAQELYSIFKFGESNTRINSLDSDGIVFSGVVELNNKLDRMIAEVEFVDDNDFEQMKERLNKLKSKK